MLDEAVAGRLALNICSYPLRSEIIVVMKL